MNLFELFVKIGVDDQASKKISSLSSNLGNGLKTAAKVGAAAITAVTAATAAMTTALVNGISKTAEYGDNIDKMSQKMGMTAESYQEWDAVMQHCGSSIESLKPAMKTLATAAESGSDAFAQLGISQEQIAGMSQEQLFDATIAGLQNVTDETQRTYLAGKLLGRGATELGPLLNTSAEDTQAMKDRVHELGGVMSNEAVKAAARYQDSLQDMKASFSGLKNSLISDFLPGMSTVMDGIASLVIGEDSAQSTISSGISQIIESMNSSLPRLFDAGKQIVGAIFQAITQNSHQMVSGGIEMLMSIVDGIIENLPILVESASEIIVTIAHGIAESLPDLIPAIVDVVVQIVATLIENVYMLVDASIAIIVALAEGLIKALPELVKSIPNIVTAIVDGFNSLMPQIIEIGKSIVTAIGDGIKNLASDAFTWGKDLIDNFIGGIKDKIQHLKDTVSSVAQAIKDFLGFSEPEKGPLSNFHTYAPDMMNLFIQGIRDNEKKLTDQIEKTFDFGERTITAGISYGSYGDGVFSSGGGYGARQVSVVQNSVRAAIHDEISKIGIYLDGNTLVGGISDRMNQGLGSIYAGNERRAMA